MSAIKFIRRLICKHDYAELWSSIITYIDGSELGVTTCVCVKCGRVE
jgi:hypothetical protein